MDQVNTNAEGTVPAMCSLSRGGTQRRCEDASLAPGGQWEARIYFVPFRITELSKDDVKSKRLQNSTTFLI